MDEVITRAAWFGAFDREIDHQGSAHDVGPRYKSPVAAVKDVLAIITHHEVMLRGHHQLPLAHIIRQFVAPAPVNLPRVALLVGKIVAVSIGDPLLMDYVAFLQRLAVHVDHLVTQPDMVARQADHAFHQELRSVYRKIKNYNVSPFDSAVGQQMNRARPSRK